jgi:hypothetical protein
VEAVGAVLDDADLVVETLHPAVREAEPDRGEHAIAVLPERAAELHEGTEVRAARPGEPGAQVLGRRARTAAVEGAQLLLQQVGAIDAGVEAGDGGEPDALLSAALDPLDVEENRLIGPNSGPQELSAESRQQLRFK